MALRRRSKEAGHELFAGFTDVTEIGVGSLATVYRARELGHRASGRAEAAERPRRLAARHRVLRAGVASRSARSARTPTSSRSIARSVPRTAGRCSCSNCAWGRCPTGCAAVWDCRCARSSSIGIKIAGALETAHRGGILHRDVKPQNILMTEFGEPALADFGVAMLQSSTQTTAGLFDFTTLHAAPELLEGGEHVRCHRRLRAGLHAVPARRRAVGVPRLRGRVAGLGDPAHPARPGAAAGRDGCPGRAVRPAHPRDEQGQGQPSPDGRRVRRGAGRDRTRAGLAPHPVHRARGR